MTHQGAGYISADNTAQTAHHKWNTTRHSAEINVKLECVSIVSSSIDLPHVCGVQVDCNSTEHIDRHAYQEEEHIEVGGYSWIDYEDRYYAARCEEY